MLIIISIQKDKNLEEIMYVLNVDGIRKFKIVERLCYWSLVAVILAFNVGRCYAVYLVLSGSSDKIYAFYAFTITEWMPILLMIMSFTPLIISLQRYFNFEYKRIRKSIIVFFLAELALFALLSLSNLLRYLIPGEVSKEISNWYVVLNFLGLYPIV